jgi:hypothetical protein
METGAFNPNTSDNVGSEGPGGPGGLEGGVGDSKSPIFCSTKWAGLMETGAFNPNTSDNVGSEGPGGLEGGVGDSKSGICCLTRGASNTSGVAGIRIFGFIISLFETIKKYN